MKYQRKIEDLISDHSKFSDYVYTPIGDAIDILKDRWEDKHLEKVIDDYLEGDIPEAFIDGFKFVIFRHICTPNYEMYRFVSAVDAYEFQPLFGEYLEDKFAPNNPSKYFLGKLCFHFGYGKNDGHKVKCENIIDFNTSNGKPLSTIKTLWGQSLVDFHKELFFLSYPKFNNDKNIFFDASNWFRHNGGVAKVYYKKFLALFIRHGILFENFLLDGEELTLTRDYFLPAFFEVVDKTGLKPLIVALSPTEIENNEFWFCHTPKVYDYIKRNKI